MQRSPLLILSVLLLIFLCTPVLSGQTEQLDLLAYNQQSINHQQKAMLGLGAWAVGNIGVGLALRGSSEGSTKHFHEMNALWNTVNLAIAGFGYYSAMNSDPAAWDLATSLQKHQQFQKILLFNTGLDVGYVLGGLYLTERAKRPDENSDRLKGFGNAIMLQGGFLFAFDLVNYVIATQLNGALPLQLGPTANGLGFLYQF